MAATELRTAFLHDIAQNPECNSRRLIFADWLEDTGDSLWAELIRVQLELEEQPHTDWIRSYTGNLRWGYREALHVIHQEANLSGRLISNTSVELALREFQILDRDGFWAKLCAAMAVPVTFLSMPPHHSFRRGLVSTVRATWPRFQQEASRMFQTAPIEEVQLLNLRPTEAHGTRSVKYLWVNCGFQENEASSGINDAIFQRLHNWCRKTPTFAEYASAEAAQKALSCAAVLWGKEQAGLIEGNS